MRNASGYQSENEWQWKNRVNRNINIPSIKPVNRKLEEVSRFSRAIQRQGNVQKIVLHVQSCYFAKKTVCCTGKVVFLLLIRSIVVVFYRSRCFHPVFSIIRFLFSLRKLWILKRASLLALAKSIYQYNSNPEKVYMDLCDMSCFAKAYIFVYFIKWQISASRFLNHLVLTCWFLLLEVREL